MAPVYIGIKGYRVIGCESNQEELVRLEMEQAPQQCRHCGSGQLLSKGKYECRVRHLDTYGRSSRLLIGLRRWQCRECGRSFVPETPGLRPCVRPQRA